MIAIPIKLSLESLSYQEKNHLKSLLMVVNTGF
jgi:hypothetical protein